MKIVQAVGWYFPESLGGTEIYVAGLAKHLTEMGHDVAIACPAPGASVERTYDHDGLRVYRYPTPANPTRDEVNGFVPVRGTDRFHHWLRYEQADVFHVHTFTTGIGLSELHVARACGSRIVATNHLASLGFVCQRGTMMRWGRSLCDGLAEPRKCAACSLEGRGLRRPFADAAASVPDSWSRRALGLHGRFGTTLGMRALIRRRQEQQREMLDLVDHFVVLNRWAFNAVLANGADPAKVSINRLGVSDDFRRKPDSSTAPTRTPLRLGYVGRLDPLKGLHELGRALAALPDDLPFRFECYGPTATDEERHLAEDLRRSLDPRRVEFGSITDRRQMAGVLSRLDVLCCPSIWLENGPTVALEAQAVGTPVIGSRIGGLSESITDGLDGRLCEPGNWRALRDALQETLLNPSGTVDRWRDNLPKVRRLSDIVSDYLIQYRGDERTASARFRVAAS